MRIDAGSTEDNVDGETAETALGGSMRDRRHRQRYAAAAGSMSNRYVKQDGSLHSSQSTFTQRVWCKSILDSLSANMSYQRRLSTVSVRAHLSNLPRIPQFAPRAAVVLMGVRTTAQERQRGP